MRRLIGFCVAVILIATAFNARAMTHDEAIAAYYRGDYATALRVFRELAEIGNESAECNLGTMYFLGQGVARDYTQAEKWIRKAADKGLARCQSDLGVLYEDGLGVERDYVQAAKWFRKAAQHAYAEGQNRLGLMYKDGRGVERDLKEAVKWFTWAAASGEFAESQYNLAVMYENGLGVARDYGEALEWYYFAGRKDDLDRLYRSGLAGTATKAGAVAVEKAVERAQVKVSCSLRDEDYGEIPPVSVLRPLAVQGNADAQQMLAKFHHRVAVDEEKAQGYEEGEMDVMTETYINARGKSIFWLRKAADGGNAAAQFALGDRYYFGSNDQRYIFWIGKSARQGCLDAWFRLFLHYKKATRLTAAS